MINRDKPVRVIRNWKHDCYTILQNGRAMASARQVHLADVEFLVRESGRNKMLRERKRNVHAYAVGRLIDYTHPDEARAIGEIGGRAIVYHPYRAAAFIDVETEAPVNVASDVHFQEDGVFYRAA